LNNFQRSRLTGAGMESYLEKVPPMVDAIKAIKEIIIANIVLIGQIPSPTFKEENRTRIFMERLAEAQIEECTTDAYGNPIGIIKGTSDTNPPIFVVAHLDTFFGEDVDHNFTVKKRTITGPGILDNSLGVAVMASLPEILRALNISFRSDIVLVGDIQSIGKGNLRGIRNLLKTWSTPIRGAVCIEGGELGRLNYYSDGMRRCEITCSIPSTFRWVRKFRPNAILMLHEVINQILELRLPQKPRARVIIGKIAGGVEHGEIAQDAMLGFEIEAQTAAAVREQVGLIKQSAGERIRTELLTLFEVPKSHPYLIQMADSGLLFAVFPEMIALRGCRQNRHHAYNVFDHTLRAYHHLEQLIRKFRMPQPASEWLTFKLAHSLAAVMQGVALTTVVERVRRERV